MRLHHYQVEAIVDRHVTGTERTRKWQRTLGKVVFVLEFCLRHLSESHEGKQENIFRLN